LKEDTKLMKHQRKFEKQLLYWRDEITECMKW